MAEDGIPRQILEDLKRVPEDIRYRFLRLLSRDETLKVLNVALQDVDDLQLHRVLHYVLQSVDEAGESRVAQDVAVTRIEEAANSTMNHALVSRTVEDYEPPSGDGSLKRKAPSLSSVVERRAKIIKAVFRNGMQHKPQLKPLEQLVDWTGDIPTPTGIKLGRTPTTETESRETNDSSGIKSESGTVATIHAVAHPHLSQQLQTKRNRGTTEHHAHNTKMLSFVVLVPGRSGCSLIQDITSLPDSIQKEIKDRFRRMSTSCQSRASTMRAICNNPAARVAKNICILREVTVKKVKASRYTFGGEEKRSADDACIHKRFFCAHVVERCDSKYAMCIVPLPEKLRQGRGWTELEFWVLPGVYDPSAK